MSRPEPERFMRRALRLAARARERTWPNPMVGAVVVRRGRVVGEGYHRRAGQEHAEVAALRQAGDRARGADLYVTLEPCHCHGRTGPCTNRILEAGIARVFIGASDPNPRECGRSLPLLRQAGVEVVNGVLAAECERLNQVYNVFIRWQRPFVVIKAAASLDGRLATRTGHARWISSEPARRYAHRLRSRAGAVLVGAGTVAADDPRLDVRHLRGRNPAVVVLDGQLRTSPRARLIIRDRGAPVWLYTSRQAAARRAERLRQAGVEVIRARSRGGRLDLSWVLADLLGRGVYRLLVEGGGRVIGELLRRRLADRLELVLAPRLLGAGGVPLADWPGPARVGAGPGLQQVSTRRLGPDLLVAGRLSYPGSA